MPKKVLIITYYWPPAGGPGVQRWLKFATYLPEFDVEPIVYVPENANYPIIDNTLESTVPNNISVLKQPIKEPYKLASFLSRKKTKTISSGIISEEKKQSSIEKLMLYVRGNFFIPDARIGWVKPSIKFLENYIKNEQIDTVITTGPPHSLHLIGLHLKRNHNIKWFADFRDPWTTIGYHAKLRLTNASKKKHKALEKQVLNAADRVIVTSFTTKKEFENITYKPITVITNGFEEEHNDSVIKLDTKFSLAHIGSLLSKRNPTILWKALQELVHESQEFSKDLELHLVGTVSKDVIDSIKKHGLERYLKLTNYVPHIEARKLQEQSQILLLIEIDSKDTRGIIPGKLFEYMSTKRPILAIGPDGWDVKPILEETNAGNYFDYVNIKALKSEIALLYARFKEGTLYANSKNIEKYSRKALAKKLSEVLKKHI